LNSFLPCQSIHDLPLSSPPAPCICPATKTLPIPLAHGQRPPDRQQRLVLNIGSIRCLLLVRCTPLRPSSDHTPPCYNPFLRGFVFAPFFFLKATAFWSSSLDLVIRYFILRFRRPASRGFAWFCPLALPVFHLANSLFSRPFGRPAIDDAS